MGSLIKKSLSVRKKELFIAPGATVMGFLVGHIVLWAVMLILGEKKAGTSFEMGTVIGIVAMVASAICMGFKYSEGFNYALSMSQSRKRIITVNLVFSVMKSICAVGLLALLNLWESFVCENFFSIPCESNMSSVFKLEFILLMILALIAFENFAGAILTRVGTKYLWIAILVMGWLPSIMLNLMHSIKEISFSGIPVIGDIIGSVSGIGGTGLIVAGAVSLALIALLPYVILRKERVKI